MNDDVGIQSVVSVSFARLLPLLCALKVLSAAFLFLNSLPDPVWEVGAVFRLFDTGAPPPSRLFDTGALSPSPPPAPSSSSPWLPRVGLHPLRFFLSLALSAAVTSRSVPSSRSVNSASTKGSANISSTLPRVRTAAGQSMPHPIECNTTP